MRAHMRSYTGSPGERENDGPRTGPERITTTRRARLERVLDLGLGPSRVLQADVRRREDPLAVVERPVVVHPLVERVEHRVQRVGIVEQRLLHADAERREQEAAGEALRVHELDARARDRGTRD